MPTSVRNLLICLIAHAAIFSSLQAIAADGALTEIDNRWSDAAVAKDAEKVASFYAEDAIAYPPNAPIAMGRAAIKKVWSDYFAIPSFRISWKARRAEISNSDDIGYTAGTYEAEFIQANGQKIQQQGKYVAIWKKQNDGTWMVSQDIWNTDAP